MQFDLATTDALLSTTRAVRKRLDLDRPVPREINLKCLELAVQAGEQLLRRGRAAEPARAVVDEDRALPLERLDRLVGVGGGLPDRLRHPVPGGGRLAQEKRVGRGLERVEAEVDQDLQGAGSGHPRGPSQ